MVGIVKQKKATGELEEIGTIQFTKKNELTFNQSKRKQRHKSNYSNDIPDGYRNDDLLENPMIYDRNQIPKHKKNLSTPFGYVEELKEMRRSRSDEGNSEFTQR